MTGERVWSVYLWAAAADRRGRQGLRTRQQVHRQCYSDPPSRELLNTTLLQTRLIHTGCVAAYCGVLRRRAGQYAPCRSIVLQCCASLHLGPVPLSHIDNVQ